MSDTVILLRKENYTAGACLGRGIRYMRREGTLYLHFPCFDGLVSAVLASDFLEQNGWKFNRRFCPVNYHLRPTWISSHLRPPCAVVDFLYHSDAQFWADHHSTTFL